LDPVVELNEADEIARRTLSKQSVTEEEFRYVLMFNLAAMTQLLWELSNNQALLSKHKAGLAVTGPYSWGSRGVRNKAMKLVPLAAIAAFLAGLGLGYLIP
jgi:hypothetical protein